MRLDDMDTGRFAPARTTAMAALAVAAIGAATVVPMGPAAAQALCMPREKIVEVLDARYHEEPIARGLASGGRLVEVFSSLDGDTWSLLLTAPDGTSCLMAEGQGWSSLPGPTIGRVS